MHRLVLGGSSAQSLGEPFSTDSPAGAGAGADEAVGGSGGDVLMRHQGITESGRAAAVAAAVAAAEAVAAAAEEATAKKNAWANSVEIKRRPRTSAAKYEKVRRDQMKARVEALREAIGDSAADLDKSSLIAHTGEHILEQRANVAELGHKLSLAVALQARLQHQVDQLTRELEAGSGAAGPGPSAAASEARRARTVAEADTLVDAALADAVCDSTKLAKAGERAATARANTARAFRRSDSYLRHVEGTSVIELEEASDSVLFIKVQVADGMGSLLHELTKTIKGMPLKIVQAAYLCSEAAGSRQAAAAATPTGIGGEAADEALPPQARAVIQVRRENAAFSKREIMGHLQRILVGTAAPVGKRARCTRVDTLDGNRMALTSTSGSTAAADSDGVEGESQPPAEGGGGAARARFVRSTARVRSVSMSDDPDEHDDAEEEVVVQRVK
jgi:hypothetical protein